MPYTFVDFDVDYILEHLPELPQERQREVVERLPPEVRQKAFQSLPSEQRRELFQALPPEHRRELFQSLPVEERLADLSEEQIRHYLEQRAVPRPSTPRKSRRKRQ